MEPKNHPIEKENHLPNHQFSGSMLILQGVDIVGTRQDESLTHLTPLNPQKVMLEKSPYTHFGIQKNEMFPGGHWPSEEKTDWWKKLHMHWVAL